MDNYNAPAVPKDLGDGLYMWGGDIFCSYPLKGTEIADNYVVFDFGVYTVKVSWTNSGGKRINPKWERTYPDEKEGDGG